MSDRIVHAVTHQGAEIVRYAKAGRWYIEWPADTRIPRKRVGVFEAARTAADHGETVHLGLPGGQIFDAKLKRISAADDT